MNNNMNEIKIETIEQIIEGKHYVFLGRRYETRLELKNYIQSKGKRTKVTTEYFNSLIDLKIVRQFPN
jgi:hypothetical protein